MCTVCDVYQIAFAFVDSMRFKFKHHPTGVICCRDRSWALTLLCCLSDLANPAAAYKHMQRRNVLCRWLVGTSYRVVYRRDPVPGMKQKRGRLTGGLTHVHGEIYINDDHITPGKQPHANHVDGDIDDHSLMRYAEVLVPYSLLCPCLRMAL